MTVLVICLTIVCIFSFVFFGFVIYHLMLLYNECNKRLQLQTKEAIERERMTREEYEQLLAQYQSLLDETNKPSPEEKPKGEEELDDEPFDPHQFS